MKIYSLFTILLCLRLVSVGQDLDAKRNLLLDSINFYRTNPIERVKESYGIFLDQDQYYPMNNLMFSDRLNRKAQRYAEKMARTGDYYHSDLTGIAAESIDVINVWQGEYWLTVSRLIIDENVPDKGHRYHMLVQRDKYIGIGIAESNIIPYQSLPGDQHFIYICIQTDYH